MLMQRCNVNTIDLNFLGRTGAIAAYLIEGPEGYVLIECGPASTWGQLETGLTEYGLKPSDLSGVLVTHIHLDHAGASGFLTREGVTVFVHAKGAPHLIDPSRLLASAGRIYGDRMDELWGSTAPCNKDKVVSVRGGEEVYVAGLRFLAVDSPGHAKHHLTFVLDDLAFTGDAAGVCLEGSSWVSVPAPPPEFNLELWLKTIDRLRALELKAIYPTHFGKQPDPFFQLSQLERALGECAHLVRDGMKQGLSRDQILDRYLEAEKKRAENAGVKGDLFEVYEASNPLFMSVDGIMRYWRKKWEKEQVGTQR